LNRYISTEFSIWARSILVDKELRELRDDIKAEDQAKALSALSVANATVRKLEYYQETPRGGVRISLALLAVASGNSGKDGANEWLIVIASRGRPITEEERRAYAERRTRSKEAMRASEEQYNAALDPESFDLIRSRRQFLTRLAEIVARSKTVADAITSIDGLTLPTGVVVGARSNGNPDVYRSFILSDTTDKERADMEKTQFSSHFSSDFGDNSEYEHYFPKGIFLSKQNMEEESKKALARSLRALPALPTSTQAKAMSDEDAYQLSAIDGSENRQRRPRVGFAQLHILSRTEDRYVLILYIQWSYSNQR
jgi:hypothetical protein